MPDRKEGADKIIKAFQRQKIRRNVKMLSFKWLKNNKGQGMVEYILIVAVVGGIVFAAYQMMGGKVKDQFERAAGEINTAHQERPN